MAKTSGGLRKTGGFKGQDSNYKGSVKNIRPLASMKENAVYREVKQGIARFHAVLGVRQKEVHLADLQGAIGVHVTENGVSKAVYLNAKTFDQKKPSIVSEVKGGYKTGFLTQTNKPIQHAITHELAHATWNSHLTSPNSVAAGKSINRMYNNWMKDGGKKGYGAYAKTNVNEFFAETATKAIHGTSDRYTRGVRGIIRKYKL